MPWSFLMVRYRMNSPPTHNCCSKLSVERASLKLALMSASGSPHWICAAVLSYFVSGTTRQNGKSTNRSSMEFAYALTLIVPPTPEQWGTDQWGRAARKVTCFHFFSFLCHWQKCLIMNSSWQNLGPLKV